MVGVVNTSREELGVGDDDNSFTSGPIFTNYSASMKYFTF